MHKNIRDLFCSSLYSFLRFTMRPTKTSFGEIRPGEATSNNSLLTVWKRILARVGEQGEIDDTSSDIPAALLGPEECR